MCAGKRTRAAAIEASSWSEKGSVMYRCIKAARHVAESCSRPEPLVVRDQSRRSRHAERCVCSALGEVCRADPRQGSTDPLPAVVGVHHQVRHRDAAIPRKSDAFAGGNPRQAARRRPLGPRLRRRLVGRVKRIRVQSTKLRLFRAATAACRAPSSAARTPGRWHARHRVQDVVHLASESPNSRARRRIAALPALGPQAGSRK